MRRRLAAIAVVLFGAAAAATDPLTLRSLFPKEADVSIDGPGLVRLDLPPEVVAACLPSLADVRLFDLEGNEVPFLLDTPRVQAVFDRELIEARPLEVRREEVPRDKGPSLRRETFELAGPGHAARGGEWALVASVAPREFVARAAVSWTGGGSRAPGRSAGSLFRLSSPRPVEKLGLPLGAAPIDRLTVTIEHEHPFWLEPSFRFETSRTIDRSGISAVPLSTRESHSAAGETVIELARPRGVVPAALRLSAQTATFDRRVVVHDEGPGRDPAPLGDAHLFRLLPDSGVEELVLPLRPARGDRLRVVIDDGDSPPLTSPTFTAVFDQPSLVASLSGAGGAAPAAILRFGGGRASVPRYDLAGLSPQPGREVYGQRAEALLRLYDPAVTHVARLGPVRDSTTFDRTPALAFAMRPGAPIDASGFAQRRPLHVQPSPEGLSRLLLSPEDLAVLRPDLADLRIVDGQSRQWPYLVATGAASAAVPLKLNASSKNRETVVQLSGPVSPLTVDRLVLDTGVPFFDRNYRLTGRTEDDHEIALAGGRLARVAGDRMSLTIAFASARVAKLILTIDDGDDAPLTITAVSANSPVPEIYVAAPAGSYALLAGAPDAAPPSYELARARDVVLAVAAEDVHTEPIVKNPGYKLSSRFMQGKGPERTLLWIALVAVVVALGALTLKLARQSPG